MTIFLGMMGVVFTLLRQNQRASEKVLSRSDATDEALLVFEKVRAEMRNLRVIGVDSSGRLEFWVLRRDSAGAPQLTPQGLADWLPGEPANPDVGWMYPSQGVLWKSFQGQVQPVAPLGPDGQVTFEWLPGLRTLTLSGQVGRRDDYEATRNSLQKFHYVVYLTNNE